ncbi:MAG: hypothetical protein ACK2U9_12825 [Anaerolineae bacterium]
MAKAAKKKKPCDKEKLYGIVEKLRAQPKQTSAAKKRYNFSDPTALRALRIHRHLRALESDILEHGPKRAVSLEADENSDAIVISIRNEEIHCCRVAYLSPREFRLLRKNRKVANILRKCPAYKDVA